MVVTIRRASTNDVFDIAQVHVDTWQATYDGLLPQSMVDGLSYQQSSAQWARVWSRPEMMLWVAEAGSGEIVGFGCAGEERGRDASYDAEIYAIYVLPNHQANGVGRKLMSAMATELYLQGFRSLLVWVLAENPYRRFYERLGGTEARSQRMLLASGLLTETGYAWKNLGPLIYGDRVRTGPWPPSPEVGQLLASVRQELSLLGIRHWSELDESGGGQAGDLQTLELRSNARLLGAAVLSGQAGGRRRRGAPHAELLAIALDPSARRQGWGKQLMIAVEDHARAQGTGELRASVDRDNYLVSGFFERFGYHALEPRSVPADDPSGAKSREREVRVFTRGL